MIGIDEAAEAIEKEAWADLIEAARGPSARVVRVGRGAALVCPEVDGVLLNRAFGVGLDAIDAVLTAYREAGVERYFIHDAGYPSDALEGRGLTRYHRSWIKVARSGSVGPGPRPPCPFEITTATPEDGADLGRIFADAFEAPGSEALFGRVIGRARWHSFVARDEGRVVAGGLLFVSDGVGYLACGATAPDHRRRGAQQALMSERIRLAVDMGCRVIFSETGERVPGERNSSYDNMLRHGFRPIYRRANWAPPGITWTRSVA